MEDAGSGTWFTALSSYFNQIFHQKQGTLRTKHLSRDSSSLRRSNNGSDEPQVVGGVESMMPVSPPTGSAARRLTRKLGGEVQLTDSTPLTPQQRSTSKKSYSLTPYPRVQHYSSTVMPSRVGKYYSDSTSNPVLDLDQEEADDCVEQRLAGRRKTTTARSPFIGINGRSPLNASNGRSVQTGSSRLRSPLQAIRIGGNDGLVDVDDDDDDLMEGVEEQENTEVVVEEPEVNIVGQFKSPGVSSFRFQPTVTSTSERLSGYSRERREGKWQSSHKIPSVSRPTIRKSNLSSLRTSSSSYGRGTDRRGGGSLFTGSSLVTSKAVQGKVRHYAGILGLSKKYRTTAQECYKMSDKQAYMELLKTSTADDVCFSRSSSIFSMTSSVPLSKTQMSQEWSRQKTKDIEEKLKKDKEQLGNISLWTLDEKNRKSDGDKDGDVKKTKPTKALPGASVVKTENGAKPKKKQSTVTLDDDDDDDIIITKETVKKMVKPNSLEQQARFSAFYNKYTPEWMQDLNARHSQRNADLDRQRQESELTMRMCSDRRKAAPSVEDSVSRRFQMLDMRHPSPRVEVSDEDDLVELTPVMEKVINNALRKNPQSEVLTEKFNIQITRRDIATLDGLNWLNDEVVNFYMNMLMERGRNDNYPSVYAFNTFFYPKLIKMGFSGVKRWTKKVDIFEHDLLLVPVHLGMHWCLATISVKEKTISYYDSMLGNNNQCLQELKKYLQDEHADKKKTTIDASRWTCDTLKDIPQQMNGSDCGMFSCKFSEYLSRKRPITFSQDHMPYFRRRMVYEIVTNRLL